MKHNAELNTCLDREVRSNKTPGLQYLILQGNEILYQRNLGMADFDLTGLS